MKNYIIGILVIIILVLGGYILYDKVLDKKETKMINEASYCNAFKDCKIIKEDTPENKVLIAAANSVDYDDYVTMKRIYFYDEEGQVTIGTIIVIDMKTAETKKYENVDHVLYENNIWTIYYKNGNTEAI